MQVQSDSKPYDDINITPMLDLAYVLLVIFILMATATVAGTRVNLPKAGPASSLAKPTTKAITVTEAARNFADACVKGIEADRQRCESLVEQSLAMCTPLAPVKPLVQP